MGIEREAKDLLDPVHSKIDFFQEALIYDVWKDKYRSVNALTGQMDSSPGAMFQRVAYGIFPGDDEATLALRHEAELLMVAGLWMPGGRILAGAGTGKRVTLMNCYVNATMPDSMEGIHQCLGNTMFTLQQGGGIGTDFSTLRPRGARLVRTGEGSAASGPIPFMHTWDATSKTIKSAGSRRGAMMATLSDTHPDLLDFIQSKRVAGALTQFNISVLISDAFMQAVKDDGVWRLYHECEPLVRDMSLAEHDFETSAGVKMYIYAEYQARELWDTILRNTYEFSEPGVIFIDQVNKRNNLGFIETIRCTNPCGEQPLPPHGACDLGAVNLARIVRRPFTPMAIIDFSLLRRIVRLGVKFLDSVIDVTDYPLEEQEKEQKAKRRIGLGISGLADMLAMMGEEYGSADACSMAQEVMKAIANEAYKTSILLAAEKGAFPLWDPMLFNTSFLDQVISDGPHISMYGETGIRNGVLLTIAPTGTTSLIYGNISSGCEPVFAHTQNRKVFKPDDTFKEYGFVAAYGYKVFKAVHGYCSVAELPSFMQTIEDLEVSDHINMQAGLQKYVDASITKTVNLPESITFERFKEVYELAYAKGCKGCTTYRPSEVRGSVLTKAVTPVVKTPEDTTAEATTPRLEAAEAAAAADQVKPVVFASSRVKELHTRPDVMDGSTYKIKWPSWSSSIYVTINNNEEMEPFEIFIQSKDGSRQEWITALTVMISALFRRGDWEFIPAELKQIQSPEDGAWIQGKYYPSVVSYIGHVIEQHYVRYDAIFHEGMTVFTAPEPKASPAVSASALYSFCPSCGQKTLTHQEGCKTCGNCGFSQC